MDTYAQAVRIMNLNDPRLLVVWDEDVKRDIAGVLSAVCRHAQLPENKSASYEALLNERVNQGTYQRAYGYTTVLEAFFRAEDFEGYYAAASSRLPASLARVSA